MNFETRTCKFLKNYWNRIEEDALALEKIKKESDVYKLNRH